MSEDILEALKLDFDQGKYKIDGETIKIGRMDASDPNIRALADSIGLRIDRE